jgi:hypothetical protein
MDLPLSGKYTFVDRNRIKVELGGLGALPGPQVYTYSVSGDELTLTDAEGKESRYRRVK